MREPNRKTTVEQPGGYPIYRRVGSRPQPLPVDGPPRGSLRGALILIAVMVAWMIVIIVLAASAGPNAPERSTPIPIGHGVVLTPLTSWSSAAGDWDVGQNAVALKRAGAYVAFAAESFNGTNDELLAEQLKDLKTSFTSYRELPATATTMAGDLPALGVLATGSSDSGRLEFELVVATSGGTGVIMEAIAAAGQLSVVQGDLDEMLRTLEVPR